ncbi:MAG TPA: DUF3365 domain-containing protein [Hydrogenothermaceae bacterium]|nr:DUF3365 domain-containing protein [Hydrogenothermaceae bacterium]
MKKTVVGALLSVPILFSCTHSNDVSYVDDNPKVIEIGENVSKKLLKTLKEELVKAISKSPYEAIEVCNKKALQLTKKVEEEVDHGIEIKRTSLKYRNPLNKPDKYEKEALIKFENTTKEGKNLKHLIQKVNENGKTYYRYYKPLKIQNVCLMCHGEPSKMDKQLLAKIKSLYPNDKATGYNLGDFRGVIRVSIPEEMVK